MAPDGLGLLLFIIVPTALALVVGLFDVDGFGNVEWAGLDNFRLMAGDGLLWRSFGITALYAALFVPLAFFASLGLALLVKDHFPGVGAVRAALFLPNAVSLVVIGLLWQFLLTDKTGAVARLTGLDDVSWLGDPDLALITLVLISVWFLMGYQMLIFLGGLQDIPREHYDAAIVDGGGPWQRFRHVTWPMLRPTSFFVLVTSTINAVTGLQVFDLVFVTTSGGPANATTTVVYYAYQQAFQFGRFGYAAAICALLVVSLGAVTAVMFALTRGGRFDA
nr:sugar ABC transporter permease [Saccharopolyspora hordei]